ncbi:MAG: PLC-like phosphodiesterase, partial [Piptocephalis tieghemiana]
VNLETIQEVRTGQELRLTVSRFSMITPPVLARTFSIHYLAAEGRKALTLIAPDQRTFEVWVQSLRNLMDRHGAIHSCAHTPPPPSPDVLIRRYWAMADRNEDGRLSFDELTSLCRNLNISLPKAELMERFHQVDIQGTGSLNILAFAHVLSQLDAREDLQRIYRSKALEHPESGMTLEELCAFIREEQKGYLPTEVAQALISKYSDDPERKVLDWPGFRRLLHSTEEYFTPRPPSLDEESLQAPLSHYYCNSSHNTYLVGNQIIGGSSVESYIQALRRGCRCVELDCWDGPNGEPIIYHGYTLTTKILFREVVHAISLHAFDSSPYPVILSLENHCSLSQQRVMATILRQDLGDALVTRPILPVGGTPIMSLPSPAALKRRFLIKKGKVKKEGEKEEGKEKVPESRSIDTSSLAQSGMESSEKAGLTEGEDPSESSNPSSSSFPINPLAPSSSSPAVLASINPLGSSSTVTKKKEKIAAELGELAVYCISLPFKDFETSSRLPSDWYISSLSEGTSRDLARSFPEQYRKHTSRHLIRVYPSGTRLGSSNYDPTIHWLAGAQVVALNWQTFDRGVHINRAMFAQNGGCGYVKKPDWMIERDEGREVERPTRRMRLAIRILSAQQLPRVKEGSNEVTDPYCEVEVMAPGSLVILTHQGLINRTIRARTHAIHNNGYSPVWDECFNFSLWHDDLIFIRFNILDQDSRNGNDMVACYSTTLASLSPGYRHLPLFNSKGERLPLSSLFIHSRLEEMKEGEEDRIGKEDKEC